MLFRTLSVSGFIRRPILQQLRKVSAFIDMLADAPDFDHDFEAEVGISAFANDARGMKGIIKQRFSDFIVREIQIDGSVTYLTSLCGKALEDKYFGPPASEAVDLGGQDAIDHIIERIEQSSKVHLQEEDKHKLTYFIRQCIERGVDCPQSMLIFPDLDKDTRKAVHAAFRVNVGDYIETEAFQSDGRSFIQLVAKHKRSGGNKRKRAEWPQGLGNYLRFTLLKENIDTMSAAAILNKNLRFNNANDGVMYSGTKDKRGVTVQKCTVYRRKPSDFARLNASKMQPSIYCGDFEYVSEPAQLGDAGGNRFEIVLRALDTQDETVIQTACSAMQSSGFVNYFGLQRFGKGGSRSHEFGKAILKSDWEACVRMLFTPRAGDRPNIASAKQLFGDGNFAEAARVLPEAMHAERSVLQRLVDKPQDYMSAYSAMPKTARMICAHAYQSYLWNKAASKRLALYGMSVVEGDLVLADPTMDVTKVQVVDKTAAGDSTVCLVKHVTAADCASGLYTIHDVLLPVPGYESVYPANEVGAYYDELLATDGLSRASYSTCHPVYREKGVYRKLIQQPGDLKWRTMTYTNPDEELAETELTTFRPAKEAKSVTTVQAELAADSVVDSDTARAGSSSSSSLPAGGKFTALQVKFSLPPGTYATMLLRELTKSSTESEFQAQLSKEAGSTASGAASGGAGAVV